MACESHRGQICHLTGLSCVEPDSLKWLLETPGGGGQSPGVPRFITPLSFVRVRVQMFQRKEGGALKGCSYYGGICLIGHSTIVSGTQWRVK